MPTVENESVELIALSWTKSEKSWGSRHGGYTLHTSEIQAIEFINNYMDTLPKNTPKTYLMPQGIKGVPAVAKIQICANDLTVKIFEKTDGHGIHIIRDNQNDLTEAQNQNKNDLFTLINKAKLWKFEPISKESLWDGENDIKRLKYDSFAMQ